MQEATEPFAIRVRDLVVGFRRHVVIDHLALDVRRGETPRIEEDPDLELLLAAGFGAESA